MKKDYKKEEKKKKFPIPKKQNGWKKIYYKTTYYFTYALEGR